MALAFLWDKRPSCHSHFAGGIWKRRFHFKKTHQIFFSSTLHRRTKTGFVFKQKSVREILWMSWCHRFRKDPFSKCLPSMHNKAKRCRFRDRLVCTVDLTREIHLRFHISPAPSDFFRNAIVQLERLGHHHYQFNRKSNFICVLEKDLNFHGNVITSYTILHDANVGLFD